MPTPLPIHVLNTTHRDYDGEALTEYDALYSGGKAWHAMAARWVPKSSEEPEELWTERRQRATYENHAAPIVDLIVAWLFSRAPEVDGPPPEWLANVDRCGTSLDLWLRGTVTAAMQDARSYVWVNLPARPAGVDLTSKADESALGLDKPFLVRLDASEVRRWWNDEHGNLRAILFRQIVDRDRGVEQGVETVWTWTYIDQTQIRRWEWVATKDKPTPAADDVAEEREPVDHRMGTTPVARLTFPTGLHVMGKLRDPVVALTRLSNDLDWSLHRWANSLLVMAMKDAAVKPVLGAGYYLRTGHEDKVYSVSPDAAGFDAMFKRLQDRREEVYRVVQQMASGVSGDSTPHQASAASKGMDWKSLEVMLTAYAEIVRGFIGDVCRIAGRPLGVAGITVSGLDGWKEEVLAQLLADMLAAVPLVKSETFRRQVALATVRRMLPDMEPKLQKQIEDEIEAADYGEAPAWEGAPQPKPGPGGKDTGGEEEAA